MIPPQIIISSTLPYWVKYSLRNTHIIMYLDMQYIQLHSIDNIIKYLTSLQTSVCMYYTVRTIIHILVNIQYNKNKNWGFLYEESLEPDTYIIILYIGQTEYISYYF